MNVVVIGMDYPDNCEECKIKSWDTEDYVCPFSGYNTLSIGRQANCQLRPLPEKYGRLIDADALEKDGYTLAIMRIDRHEDGTLTNWCELIPLEDAPTIVEAEV